MKLILLSLLIFTAEAFAIGCDCEVRVSPPTTASHELASTNLKTYELEEYSSYSVKNQNSCRNKCLKEFEKDMPTERLNALLLTYGETLIQERALGHNCTGLTTVKFPVRVKAKLGQLGLGNVVDIVQVVTHEEQCF